MRPLIDPKVHTRVAAQLETAASIEEPGDATPRGAARLRGVNSKERLVLLVSNDPQPTSAR